MYTIFDFKRYKLSTRIACCSPNDDIIEFDNISYTNTIPFVPYGSCD